jgi:hypothetical protein
MDIQHLTNPQYSKKYFIGYNISSAQSIAIDSREHFVVTKNRTKEFASKENFIERELQSLKDITFIPNEIMDLLSNKLKNETE